MATYGKIGEFDPSSEKWDNYIERAEQFYIANDINDDVKKRAILLSSCGAKTYQLLRGLSDNNPSTKSYAELNTLMKEHLYPARNPIAERFKFNTRDRLPNESIAEYLAVLRRLSEHCEYGTTLNQMLRDRLVCGVKYEKIQQRLLSEKALTLEKALQIAYSMESAVEYSKTIVQQQSTNSEPTPVNKLYGNQLPNKNSITGNTNNNNRECYRCGSNKHKADTCSFKEAECFYCHRKGHTLQMCRQKKRNDEKNKSITTMEVDTQSEIVEQFHVSLYKLGKTRNDPIHVNVNIGNKTITMEVDTGAALTVISEKIFHEHFSGLSVKPTNLRLKTYTKEIITPVGSVEMMVEYKNQQHTLPLIVVPGNSPTLLGRNWLKFLRLDWPSLFHMEQSNELEKVLKQHENVFKEEMGLLKDFQVHIPVDPSISPKFFKARSVPYALKEKIDNELDRLVREGIYEPVEYSR